MRLTSSIALFIVSVFMHTASADKLYIRADAGYSWTWDQSGSIVLDFPPPNTSLVDMSMDSVPEGQLGFGYFWEPYLRFDITGVLTGNREITTSCSHKPSLCLPGTKGHFTLTSSELFANVYYELASIWATSPTPFHPYIGFSLGSAHHNMDSIKSTGNTGGFTFHSEVPGHSEWQFAWRGIAGIAFTIANNLLLDLSYVYMDAGQATSGDRIEVSGLSSSLPIRTPLEVDVQTQELYLGLRHQF